MKNRPAGLSREASADRRERAAAVADDGEGIPAPDRALVTQRFYRARSDGGGAGLGLSLVKAIADLHGFDLRFADTGSAVSLFVRLRQPGS